MGFFAAGVFDVVSGFPPGSSDEGWSAGEAAADGALMFLATSDGHLTCHDTRQPDSSSSWVIGNRKVGEQVLVWPVICFHCAHVLWLVLFAMLWADTVLQGGVTAA